MPPDIEPIAAASAAQAAAALVATWRDISVALLPLLGQQAIHALYRRSLHLTARTYPWLQAATDVPPDAQRADAPSPTAPADLLALTPALESQTTADACAAANALLHTFHELLIGLVGRGVSDQLLASLVRTAAPPTELASPPPHSSTPQGTTP